MGLRTSDASKGRRSPLRNLKVAILPIIWRVRDGVTWHGAEWEDGVWKRIVINYTVKSMFKYKYISICWAFCDHIALVTCLVGEKVAPKKFENGDPFERVGRCKVA